MLKKILIAMILLISSMATAAPSWCRGASTRVERSICSDPTLSSMDDQLNYLYSKAQASLGASGLRQLIAEQRFWLRERNQNCKSGSVLCLQAHYQMRISELRSMLGYD